MNNPHDNEYNRLLKTVLEKGRWKNNRTGVRTLGVFGEQAKFDLSQGFPLLTTKKVFFRGIVHELLWFIKGDTNIKYLVDNDVHIWDEWAFARYKKERIAAKRDIPFSQEQFIANIKGDETFAAKWGGLGEGTYGGMWRAFPYYSNSGVIDGTDMGNPTRYLVNKPGAVDQLQKVIDKLKTNPDDRRLIVSSWHPYHAENCSLPPCHCYFQFGTEELTPSERMYLKYGDGPVPSIEFFDEYLDGQGVPKRRLNCHFLMRSNDIFLGLPFNIASYALLTHMVAQTVNMQVGTLTFSVSDLHLYENHLEQAKLQLSRASYTAPTIVLNPDIKSVFDFKYEDIKITNYHSHPKIDAPVAV